MRRLLSILVLAGLASTASRLTADERYDFPGQDWGSPARVDYRAEADCCQPLRRNFGAVNLHPQRVTRRPNPNLLFRSGWGYGFPWGFGPYRGGWGFGPFWGGWGFGGWGFGFRTWGYGFGFAGGGAPASSVSAGWTPGPTQLTDGWYVGPQGLARRGDDRQPSRGSLPPANYEGSFYW